MPIRDVHANKKGNTTPLLTLVRGDNLTQIIRMIVQRRYGGVDLSDLTWSIVLENADGVTDNHYISDVEIDDDSIEVRWNVHHVATASVGDTRFELEGIKYDEDGSKIPVWQSGIYYIRITEDINHTPSELEIKQLTAVQQLILYVDGELKNVLAAKEEAEKAATAAMEAVNKANELAEEAKKIIEEGKIDLSNFPIEEEPQDDMYVVVEDDGEGKRVPTGVFLKSSDEALDLLAEMGFIEARTSADGELYTDNEGRILIV